MITTACEECFYNIDIMLNICKYLNYKEEYALLNTTKDLQYFIINYIWKTKYKEVEILFDFGYQNCVMSNKIGTILRKRCSPPKFELFRIIQTNNAILDRSEVEMFINYNKENISKLQIQNNPSSYIPTDTFKPIKNLKVLNLIDTIFNYTHLKDLINNLNLEEFTFYNYEMGINPNRFRQTNLDSDINVEKLKAFKTFIIREIHNRDEYLHFESFYLPNFENLCHLHLEANITVNFFDIILQFCKKLTHLQLLRSEITIFKPLPMLQELELYECKGLNWNNLKTILSEMNLKCFRSFYTSYYYANGTPDYFYINPTLQEIHFNPKCEEIFNLLSYNDGKLNDLREMYLDVEPCRYNIELPNITSNLKVFHINIDKNLTSQLIYMRLQNLQKLIIDSRFFINMNVFSHLLKLENLQELSIFHLDSCQRIEDINILGPLSAVQTNLHYLHICWPVVEYRLVFICDLLRINRKLTLICRQIDYNNIIDIVSRTTFLTHCNTINVCGFHLDRLSILNDCIETLNQLKSIIDTFDELNLETYFILQ